MQETCTHLYSQYPKNGGREQEGHKLKVMLFNVSKYKERKKSKSKSPELES